MKILIAASTLALLATVPANAQGTLGAAVDKLTADAIGGMTMGDRATNKLEVERSQTGSLLTSKLVGATV